MNKSKELFINNIVKNKIFTIRGMQVMIDRDLAVFYEIPTKRLNEQVKRNIDRFPKVFRFQLIDSEKNELVANCDRFEKLKYSSVNPYAFTEQGVAMLSAVLRSKTAISISIQIMQAFVEMKRFLTTNAGVLQRLDKVEQKQIVSDKNFEIIFNALEDKNIKPRQGIFFDGQVFDAYKFVSDLIRSANRSIVLIDNYVDDTVLTHLSKRNKNVKIKIITKKITKQLSLDVDKFNKQFSPLEIKEFKNSHDRFIIIDKTEVYHFGASLKDLGKKWFAFSKMDIGALEILNRINFVFK